MLLKNMLLSHRICANFAGKREIRGVLSLLSALEESNSRSNFATFSLALNAQLRGFQRSPGEAFKELSMLDNRGERLLHAG